LKVLLADLIVKQNAHKMIVYFSGCGKVKKDGCWKIKTNKKLVRKRGGN
jgi:hypothetical protein